MTVDVWLHQDPAGLLAKDRLALQTCWLIWVRFYYSGKIGQVGWAQGTKGLSSSSCFSYVVTLLTSSLFLRNLSIYKCTY